MFRVLCVGIMLCTGLEVRAAQEAKSRSKDDVENKEARASKQSERQWAAFKRFFNRYYSGYCDDLVAARMNAANQQKDDKKNEPEVDGKKES